MKRLRPALLWFLLIVTAVYHGGTIWATFIADNISVWYRFSFDPQADVPTLRAIEQPVDGRRTVGDYAQAGLKDGDQLKEIVTAAGERFPILSSSDEVRAKRQIRFGEGYSCIVERRLSDGSHATFEFKLPAAGWPDLEAAEWLLIICFRIVLPISSLAAAGLLLYARPHDRYAQLGAFMFALFSCVISNDPETLPAISHLAWYFSGRITQGLIAPLLLTFFLRFPRSSPIEQEAPWLKWVALGWGGMVATASVLLSLSRAGSATLFNALVDNRLLGFLFELIDRVGAPIAVLFVLLALASLVANRLTSSAPDDIRRLQVLMWGTVISLGPLAIAVVWETIAGLPNALFLGPVSLVVPLFPLTFVYVVLRHRVFGIRLIVRRGLQYALLSRGFWVLATVIFGVTFAAAQPMIAKMMPVKTESAAPLAAVTVAAALAMGIRAINRRVMPVIDRQFFRDAYDARQILARLASQVRQQAGQPERLLATVAGQIHAALYPRSVTLFVRDGAKGRGGFVSAYHSEADEDLGVAQQRDQLSPPPFLEGNRPEWLDLERRLVDSPDAIELIPGNSLRRTRCEMLLDADPAAREMFERHQLQLLVPLATGEKIVGFLALGARLSDEPYSPEDHDLLEAVAGQLALAIDYAGLIGEARENERLKQELRIAQDVQEQLFPRALPKISTLRLAGACRPAREVGGDYFDYVELPDGNLGIAVADISGKGVSAALLMASLQGALRGLAASFGSRVSELALALNQLLMRIAPSSKFATLFYAHYDDRERRLTWVNAGHNPPLLLEAGSRTARRLESTGIVLGVLSDARFGQSSARLEPGDLVLIYTDGISEAQSADGAFFDEQRIVALLESNPEETPERLLEMLLQSVDRFAAGAPQHDDMTVVVMRVV